MCKYIIYLHVRNTMLHVYLGACAASIIIVCWLKLQYYVCLSGKLPRTLQLDRMDEGQGIDNSA